MRRTLSAAQIAEYIAKTYGRRYWPYPIPPDVAAELDRREEAQGRPRAVGGNKHLRYDHSEKGLARRCRYNRKREKQRREERLVRLRAQIATLDAEIRDLNAYIEAAG